ncbi:hypothetical protein J6590_047050 [Homalodisca vitripennis]|nr:hypothetical protein J6590_047050 [Homalodisca vitripennis]
MGRVILRPLKTGPLEKIGRVKTTVLESLNGYPKSTQKATKGTVCGARHLLYLMRRPSSDRFTPQWPHYPGAGGRVELESLESITSCRSSLETSEFLQMAEWNGARERRAERGSSAKTSPRRCDVSVTQHLSVGDPSAIFLGPPTSGGHLPQVKATKECNKLVLLLEDLLTPSQCMTRIPKEGGSGSLSFAAFDDLEDADINIFTCCVLFSG